MISRRRLIEAAVVGSMGGLVAGMATVDETVRGYLTHALSREPSSALASVAAIERAALTGMDTVSTQGWEHPSLAIFAVGAGVLVLLMSRT